VEVVKISLARSSSIALLGLVLFALAPPLVARAQTPDPQSAYCENRGNAYARDVQIDGCTAVIRSGRETPDKLALAFSRRGNAYAALKEYANAIADFDQAGQLAPNNSYYQNSRCWYRAVANRELEVARAACDAALKLDPGDASAFDSRGMVGLRQGRFMDAWHDFDAAKRRSDQYAPSYPSFLFGRGVATLGLGRGKEGQADIALATELDARIAQTYASYGVTPVLRAPAVSAAQAVSSFRDCSDCPEMVSIPAGSFMMGSPEGESGREKDEGPQRRVTVRAFAAGKYEVTWAEWDRCVAAGGCPMLPESVTKNRNPTTRPGLFGTTEPVVGEGTDAAHPVTSVKLEEAQAFVKWISKKTGHTYRLLSEAEWEYAARAGTTTAFSFGDELWALDANSATYERQTYRASTPVGSFPANAFGLHDMHGNAAEMLADCYEPDYARGQPSDGSAYVNDGTRATYGKKDCFWDTVVRGGSWSGGWLGHLRSAARDKIEVIKQYSNDLRDHQFIEVRSHDHGFRVARSRDLAASAPVRP